jgi:hypothetical protein
MLGTSGGASRQASSLPAFPLLRALCVSAMSLSLAGCGPRGEPAPPVQPAPGTRAQAKPEEKLDEVETLDAARGAEFRVKAEKRSMAVVEHYDRALAARGWQKLAPKSPESPGQRKWISMASVTRFTDSYDAAWKDPQTGRVAFLTVWHTAESPAVQQGTFEIYEKGQAPP